MTASTGVTNGVMRYKISEPGAHRIGISLASGVFSLVSSDGSDLTFNNAGFITLKSITPGILKEYFLTANQSFNDATSGAGSDITGALFGYPTGVAVTDDVIFTGYAVVNDAETAVAIMIGVDDTLTSAPANTLIGTPSSPTAASTSGSLFSFTDVTTTDYENNPLVPIFRMRMRMDVNDDWTVQTLNNSDGMIPPGEWLPITIETDSGTATMYQRKFSFLGSGDASTSASGNGVIVDSTPAGSGADWQLISTTDLSTPVASVDYTDLDYTDILIIADSVNTSGSSNLRLFASVDNGSTFYTTSGDYKNPSSSTQSDVSYFWSSQALSTNLRSTALMINNAKGSNCTKTCVCGVASSPQLILFTASKNPINALRFAATSGNLNAGTLYLLGR